MNVVLMTARVRLRQVTIDDVDVLFELDGDPLVMRYITGGRATPRAELVDDIIPAWLEYYERYEGYGFWIAEARLNDGFAGWFHLRPKHGLPADEPELGYRLRREVWGQGLATEVGRALIDRAFGEFGATRVYAETMAVNTASRRVMEKSGLRYVRTFHQPWPDRIDGDEHGDVEYELTRAEWKPSS